MTMRIGEIASLFVFERGTYFEAEEIVWVPAWAVVEELSMIRARSRGPNAN